MDQEIQEPKPVIQNLFTIRDYASLMGIDRRTVYNWLKNGNVKTVSFLGRKWVDKSTYINK